ncbi:MAG: hypothetical protein NT118_11695 [Lentisphaerae bacterium]|nr:hypothetical protein [Lentisphaerota bacterium]
MRSFTRKAATEDNPASLPDCYSFAAENLFSHEQCGRCKIREICKEAKELPILSYEPFHDIVNKVETFGEGADVESFHCQHSQDFVFFDDKDRHKKYTYTEMLQMLRYVFEMTPREFFYVQCKILHPEFSLQQIAVPLGQTRQAISKRFNELVKSKPELIPLLRIRRHSDTQRPEATP